MASSLQHSPNGVKPMISSYVNVSHAWFDYIRNYTDIKLDRFYISTYSNYVAIAYRHDSMSYEDCSKISTSTLIKEESEAIGFYLPELLYNEGIPFYNIIINHIKYGNVPMFVYACYWEKTENGDELKTALFTNYPFEPDELYLCTNRYLLHKISEDKKAYRQVKAAYKKVLNKHNSERAKYAYALKMIDGEISAN